MSARSYLNGRGKVSLRNRGGSRSWPCGGRPKTVWPTSMIGNGSDGSARSGFVSDAGQSAPTAPLAVFRGSALRTPREDVVDTASRYRWRLRRVPVAREPQARVYKCLVDPAAVLALFDRRSEDEVVVDPSLLSEIGEAS